MGTRPSDVECRGESMVRVTQMSFEPLSQYGKIAVDTTLKRGGKQLLRLFLQQVNRHRSLTMMIILYSNRNWNRKPM